MNNIRKNMPRPLTSKAFLTSQDNLHDDAISDGVLGLHGYQAVHTIMYIQNHFVRQVSVRMLWKLKIIPLLTAATFRQSDNSCILIKSTNTSKQYHTNQYWPDTCHVLKSPSMRFWFSTAHYMFPHTTGQ